MLGAVAAGFQLVDDLAVVQRMRVPIAAVNAHLQEIYVNPGCRLSFEEWKFDLAHEFLHAALRHDIRREERDPILWNVACDYIINGWLVEMNVGQMPEGLLYDEHFKGMSAETVYDKLCENIRYYLSLDPKDIIYGGDKRLGNAERRGGRFLLSLRNSAWPGLPPTAPTGNACPVTL